MSNEFASAGGEAPCAAGVPALSEIPLIPRGPDDDIVFRYPWEAKAFALVVNLFQRGHYTWAEWAEQISAEIKAAGAGQDGARYYLLWLTAAEKLVAKKALATSDELRSRKDALEHEQGGPSEEKQGNE